MKKIRSLLLFLAIAATSLACPVCERNQPEMLRGITHGAGPESRWDYIIVWVTVAVVFVTLIFAVKYLIRPGEKSAQHIKRTVLNLS